MPLMAYGRLAGLFAAFCALLQLLFISRASWVEQAFGFDRLTRLHKYNGFLVVLFVVAHGVLITLQYAVSRDQTRLATLRGFVTDQEGVLAAMIAAVLIIGIVVISIGVVRRLLAYETWYFIHLAAYLAVVLAFGHQVESGGDFTANLAFAWYWYGLHGLVFLSVLACRFVRPAWAYVRHGFVVDKVVRETDDVTSVYIAGRNIAAFRIAAGQFVVLRFLTRGMWWQAHPFSLSCSPNDTHLRVSIKNLGDFTARIPALVPGTRVVVDGPYGVFTARTMRRTRALLIAGGIGITPLRALVEELCEKGIDTVVLVANRTKKNIMFNAELEALARCGTVRVHHVLSHDAAGCGEKGRIDATLISRLVPDCAVREAYVCGPQPMMLSIVHMLRSLGIPRRAIHYEMFAL